MRRNAHHVKSYIASKAGDDGINSYILYLYSGVLDVWQAILNTQAGCLKMTANLIGAGLSVLAVTFGLITGVLVKLLSLEGVSILVILFYRFWLSLPLLFLAAFLFRRTKMMQIGNRKLLLMRCVLGTATITLWFLALRYAPLGLAAAMFQSSVLFVTLLAPFWLGEKVGPYRWSAVLLGLIGVFIITNPFNADLSIGVLFGVAGALLMAVLNILLRQLGKTEHPVSVACWYNLFGGIVISLIVLLSPYLNMGLQIAWPDLSQPNNDRLLLLLVLLGVAGSCLQVSVTSSFRYGEAVVVSSLRYLQVPGGGVVGYLLFSEEPTGLELLGAGIVVSACLFILWREVMLMRKHAASAN